MSQKKQEKQKKETVDPADKWRDLAEQEATESTEDVPIAALDELSKTKLTDITNKLEEEVESYKHEVLRAKAEVENIRRRMERDVANAHKYGSERLIVSLLPVIDSLVRGLEESRSEDLSVQTLRDGMELTLDLLLNVLKKNGVSEINPKPADPFDPAIHEAMSTQSDPNAEPNTILQVLQKGYSLNGRVIRAAMVMVAN